MVHVLNSVPQWGSIVYVSDARSVDVVLFFAVIAKPHNCIWQDFEKTAKSRLLIRLF